MINIPKMPPAPTADELELLRKLDEWTNTVRTTRTQGLMNVNMYKHFALGLSDLTAQLFELANAYEREATR